MKSIKIIVIAFFMVSCGSETLNGQPWNEEKECWEETREAGSYSGSDGGGDLVTLAKSPNGKVWKFSQTTIPDDFSLLGDDDEELRNNLYQKIDSVCE